MELSRDYSLLSTCHMITERISRRHKTKKPFSHSAITMCHSCHMTMTLSRGNVVECHVTI